MKSIRKVVKEFPPIKKYRLARYRRQFFTPGTKWPRFYGLFESRMAAESAASSGSSLVGYDNSEVVQVNLDFMAKTWITDYPVLFWLSKLLHDHPGLFDLGGHVGTKYRAWRTHLDLPAEFTWTVCDLPSIVEAGQEMSADVPQLKFTTNRLEANEKGILLSTGALQYANFDLAEILEALTLKPPHVLLNNIPSHRRPDAYTLENLHYSIVPYRIFDEEKLIRSLAEFGFEMVDRWKFPRSIVRVPFTNLGETDHLGFYFRKLA